VRSLSIPSQSDSAPVRPGEELDLAALSHWLSGKIDGAERGFTVEQFLTVLRKTDFFNTHAIYHQLRS
jgi:hypothetical protein